MFMIRKKQEEKKTQLHQTPRRSSEIKEKKMITRRERLVFMIRKKQED